MLTKLKNLVRSYTSGPYHIGVNGTPLPTPQVTWESIMGDLCDSASGIAVNRSAVMGYPPTRRAILWIANRVAGLPVFCQRYKGDERERDYTDYGYKLLMESPNPFYTPFVFKRELIIDAIFRDGIAAIDRDEYSNATQLMRLPPDQVTIEVRSGEPWYIHNLPDGSKRPYHFTNIFHIRNAGPDGLADSLTAIARDSLGLGLSLQNYAARFFREGRGGTTQVSIPTQLWDNLEKRNEFVAKLKATYEGQQNAHKWVFTREGVSIEETSNDNENSQMLQSREFDLIQCANLIGVEPIDLGAKVATSYASLRERTQAALDNALNPWLIQFEQEADLKLRTESDKRLSRRYYEFERKALLTMSPQEEEELIEKQVNNGLASEEYGRRKLNLPQFDESETYRRPSNVKIVGEEPPAPVLPQPEIPQDDTEDDTEDDKAKELTKGIVKRLVTRVAKSVESGKTELETHRAIWLDHLSAYPQAETFTDNTLIRWQEELDHCLPEQRAGIFQRIDTNKLTEDLWATKL